MDVKRKVEIAKTAITSIGTHYDEDSVVLDAALSQLADDIQGYRGAIQARAKQKAEALFAPDAKE